MTRASIHRILAITYHGLLSQDIVQLAQ